MSYILDALRKADAERERGAVPGLHAQSVALDANGAHTSHLNQKLIWAVSVLSLLVMGLLAWAFWGRSPQADVPATAVLPTPSSTTPPTMPPAVPIEQGNYPPIATPVAQPAPAAQVTARLMSKTTVVAPTVQQASTNQAADNRVYHLQELPESVRRELPNLTVGGAMYADTPANRMLIINSQVFHEGDKLGTDLTLEEIRLKSAVFRFRTYRYQITY